MNKYILTIGVLCFAIQINTEAQNPKVTSTYNYLQYYDQDGKSDNLMDAMEAINLAAKHDQTKGKGKTWYFRGQVYDKIHTNEELSPSHPDALDEAWDSYKKCLELNDPKFRDKDDALQNVYVLTNSYLTKGFDLYSAKQYQGAFDAYMTIFEIRDFLATHGKEIKLEEQIIKLNTALAAIGSDNMVEAKRLLHELVDSDHDNVLIYKKLSGIYLAEKNTPSAQEVLEKGIKKYPNDIGLLIDELNIFLSQGKQAEAIDKLKKAIELEPDNAQLHFALGTAYEHLKEMDNAKAAYEKAVEVNPEHYDSYSNLGALSYNKAIDLNLQMNELGFSSADQKKYEVLKTERDTYYNEALPFFEKAYEIKDDQTEILTALKEIYAKMGDYEKSNAMKARLEEVRSGK